MVPPNLNLRTTTSPPHPDQTTLKFPAPLFSPRPAFPSPISPELADHVAEPQPRAVQLDQRSGGVDFVTKWSAWVGYCQSGFVQAASQVDTGHILRRPVFQWRRHLYYPVRDQSQSKSQPGDNAHTRAFPLPLALPTRTNHPGLRLPPHRCPPPHPPDPSSLPSTQLELLRFPRSRIFFVREEGMGRVQPPLLARLHG